MCSSVKARGDVEKTSSTPTVESLDRTGTATIDRMFRARQASPSTLGSVSVSPHRRVRPLRRHSPEMPVFSLKRTPNSGEVSPLRPKQSTALPRRMPSAAPLAPVTDCAAQMMASSKTSGLTPSAATCTRRAFSTASGRSKSCLVSEWAGSNPGCETKFGLTGHGDIGAGE